MVADEMEYVMMECIDVGSQREGKTCRVWCHRMG